VWNIPLVFATSIESMDVFLVWMDRSESAEPRPVKGWSRFGHAQVDV
jgi:hypothetical protein